MQGRPTLMERGASANVSERGLRSYYSHSEGLPSPQIQHRRQDPRLALRQPSNLHSVIRQAVQHNHIPQQIDKAPRQQQQAIIPPQQMRREAQLRRLDQVVAIPDQRGRDAVPHEPEHANNPQRPRQRNLLDHRRRAQAHGQPSKPAPAARQPRRQTPLVQEPLRHDRHGRDEQTSNAHSDEQTLREVQMPDFLREGRGDEAAGEHQHAGGHDEAPAELAGQDRAGGCDEHGGAEFDAADEGVVEGCGGGEVGGAEVVGEVDAVGLANVFSLSVK